MPLIYFNIHLKILVLIILITFFLPSCLQNNQKTITDYMDQGLNAYQKQDYQSFLMNLKKAAKLAPYNPDINYNLARAYALTGNKEAAIEYLEKAVQVGFYINPKHLNDFNSIRHSEAFEVIQNKIKSMKVPINNSKVAFKIMEKDLMPEGIAYDPVKDIFYIGSIYKRKIICIDSSGNASDFVEEKQDGLWSVLGIRVDVTRRILWVNSTALSLMRGYKNGEYGVCGVFKYNLENGKLLKKYLLDTRPVLHSFNDLVVNSKGDVFITDSLFGAVYLISSETDRLELFIKPKRVTYPNGISLSKDEENLFVAHKEGVSVINVKTKACIVISDPDDGTLTGIDGLYCYKNFLIAIQRDNWRGRIIRFSLDKNSVQQGKVNIISFIQQYLFFKSENTYHINTANILESGNPLFQLPTTGVIVGDIFYYIANSQLDSFNKDFSIYPMDELYDIVVMKNQL